jgi:hypothetical protein
VNDPISQRDELTVAAIRDGGCSGRYGQWSGKESQGDRGEDPAQASGRLETRVEGHRN